MSTRVLLSLVAVIGLVVVLAAGLGRVSYTVGGEQVSCPDRVFTSAVEALTDQNPDPCAGAAQDRLYAVGAGLMGLVLISGLLARRSH